MTQRTRFKLGKLLFGFNAIIVTIGAVYFTVTQVPLIISLLFILIGYMNIKAIERVRDTEANLHYEILLEDLLDRIIKAKESSKEMKLDKELEAFIELIGKKNLEKFVKDYIREK